MKFILDVQVCPDCINFEVKGNIDLSSPEVKAMEYIVKEIYGRKIYLILISHNLDNSISYAKVISNSLLVRSIDDENSNLVSRMQDRQD